MTVTRLGIALLIIWISSIVGLSCFLLFDLGPNFLHGPVDVDAELGSWSWPIPFSILSLQVNEFIPVYLMYVANCMS